MTIDMSADPIALIQNLDLESVKRQLTEQEEAREKEMDAEKNRYQGAIDAIKMKYQGRLDALRQIRKIIDARDGKKGITKPSGRSAGWAPKIYDLLREKGPMASGHIIKALNGTATIYSTLSRDDRFEKQSDGRWAIADGQVGVPRRPGRKGFVGEVTAVSILTVLAQRGPQALQSLAGILGARQELILKVLRGDRRFGQDKAGFWTNAAEL